MLGAVLTCAYRYTGSEEFDLWFSDHPSAAQGQLYNSALRADLSGSPTFWELTKRLSELCSNTISQSAATNFSGRTNTSDPPSPESPDGCNFYVHDLLGSTHRAPGFDRINSPTAVRITCQRGVETTTIGLEFVREQHAPELIPQFLESLQILMQGLETTPEVPIT